MLDHVELLTRFPHLGGVVRKYSRVRKLVHSPILVYYKVHEAKHLNKKMLSRSWSLMVSFMIYVDIHLSHKRSLEIKLLGLLRDKETDKY